MIIRKQTSEDIDVIEALELTYFCQRYNCLPGTGGLLDQDPYRIWQIDLVEKAQDERAKLDEAIKKHKPQH